MAAKADVWCGVKEAMKLTGRGCSAIYRFAMIGKVRTRRIPGMPPAYNVSDLKRLEPRRKRAKAV